MAGVLRQVHASIALHAVAGVDPEAAPDTAQVAEGAMIDGAARVVIIDMTDGAMVTGHRDATILAVACRGNARRTWLHAWQAVSIRAAGG